MMKDHLKQVLIKKVIGKFKDLLGGKIMKESCALRAKTYAYLLDDDNEIKKAKRTKKCVIKRRLMFENIGDHHNVYTEEVNKIVLNSSGNKRLRTFDGVTTYPYGTNAFEVCESEMMIKLKAFKKRCDSEMMIKLKAIPIKLYYNKR